MTEQFANSGGGDAETLNLALRRLGLEDTVQWIYENYAETLANLDLGEPLPAEGVPVGPEDIYEPFDESIRAMPTDYTFRQAFAGDPHRKEWRSILAAIAYLMKEGKVGAPARPGPVPGGSPTAATDTLNRQLRVVSFADGEGTHTDIVIDGVLCQAKSLSSRGVQPGLKCDLSTGKKPHTRPYHGYSFQKLVAVYVRGSYAYIWIIPMQKLREEGKVEWKDEAGGTSLTVHMSEEQAKELPEGPICEPLADSDHPRRMNNKWTEKCFAGYVKIEGVLSA